MTENQNPNVPVDPYAAPSVPDAPAAADNATPRTVPAGYDQPAQSTPTPSYQQPLPPVAQSQPTPMPGYTQQPYAQQGYGQPGMVPAGAVQKSKVAAGVLGIVLGSLGIHNFYLGKTRNGLIQLLVSVLSLGTLMPLMGIWGLVEGILILVGNDSFRTDANGVPLKD